MTNIPTVAVVEPKPWWQSRTIRFNALCAVLIALEASFSMLQPHVPGNVYAYISVALAVGNAFLRTITVTSLIKGA